MLEIAFSSLFMRKSMQKIWSSLLILHLAKTPEFGGIFKHQPAINLCEASLFKKLRLNFLVSLNLSLNFTVN